MDPLAFLRAKTLEMRQRHVKYEDTPYSLEPNCKESPGGLRDLQIILWVAQAAGYGRTWEELRSAGFVTDEEYEHLVRCESTLQRLRIRLHYQLNRREDRLLFDYQTSLAEQLNCQPVAAKRASEVLMQDYYRNAKSVTQLNVILLQNIGAAIFPPSDQAPVPINERFQIAHEMLDVRHEHVFLETALAGL